MGKETENKQTPTPPSGDILDSIDNKMTKLDRIFDHFGIIWKKHWGKITILAVGTSIYFFMQWAMSLPPVEPEPEQTYQSADSTYTDEYADSTATY